MDGGEVGEGVVVAGVDVVDLVFRLQTSSRQRGSAASRRPAPRAIAPHGGNAWRDAKRPVPSGSGRPQRLQGMVRQFHPVVVCSRFRLIVPFQLLEESGQFGAFAVREIAVV